MRMLVTFIMRLWVDPQAETPAWEGQVECVASGERAHVRSLQDVARFVASHTVVSPNMEEPRDCSGMSKKGANHET